MKKKSFVKRITLRVRYAETDQMGVVYYGIYPQYFEVGRVEALRTVGMPYKKMEEHGIMLPVLKLEIEYFRPAKYDDELTIETIISELPTAKMDFDHRIFDSDGNLITKGKVQLVFVDKENRKPMRAPKEFIDLLEEVME